MDVIERILSRSCKDGHKDDFLVRCRRTYVINNTNIYGLHWLGYSWMKPYFECILN